jgi:hypothetical protein
MRATIIQTKTSTNQPLPETHCHPNTTIGSVEATQKKAVNYLQNVRVLKISAMAICMILSMMTLSTGAIADPLDRRPRWADEQSNSILNGIGDAANSVGSWVAGAASSVTCELGLGGCPAPPPRRKSPVYCTSGEGLFGVPGRYDKAEQLVAYAFGSATEFKCMD